MSLLYASTRFEHYVLIIRRSKLYSTASGIITPVTGRQHTGVMIPEHSENDERKAHMSDQALLETESKRAKDASLHEKNTSSVPLLHLVKLIVRLV
jgi:hypothetical protein